MIAVSLLHYSKSPGIAGTGTNTGTASSSGNGGSGGPQTGSATAHAARRTCGANQGEERQDAEQHGNEC
jgi:hypothetical protein